MRATTDSGAAFVEVYRAAGEDVLAVAEAVETYVDEHLEPTLPAGIEATVWHNDAERYEERRNLLLSSGALGLLLVLAALALFLDLRVAAWVVVGMATSFIGALAAALLLDVSINTNTLFGFVVVVGLVVDDAIVVAEHVHAERLRGGSGEEAAVLGTRRIARPLVFAVLTTVAAFLPLLLLPGPVGELGRNIAFVPICVLVLSLIESLLILPRHLAHLPDPDQPAGNRAERFLSVVNSRVDRCPAPVRGRTARRRAACGHAPSRTGRRRLPGGGNRLRLARARRDHRVGLAAFAGRRHRDRPGGDGGRDAGRANGTDGRRHRGGGPAGHRDLVGVAPAGRGTLAGRH